MALSNRPSRTKAKASGTSSGYNYDWRDDLATDAQHRKLVRMVKRKYGSTAGQFAVEQNCADALSGETFCLNSLTKDQIGRVFRYLEDE